MNSSHPRRSSSPLFLATIALVSLLLGGCATNHSVGQYPRYRSNGYYGHVRYGHHGYYAPHSRFYSNPNWHGGFGYGFGRRHHGGRH